MAATAEAIAKLAEPTPLGEIKKRPIFNKEKVKIGELDYIDARFVMDRFDQCIGPANWADEYRPVDGGIVGRIGILTSEGWVWKEDVGTESTIEETKGSFSDAFKRAAVKWGVARDLYDTRSGDRVQAPAGQSSVATRARTGKPTFYKVDNASAPWICPEHQAVVAWPAGTSAAGRKYDAFYACPEGRQCTHRAPAGLRVSPAHLVIQSAAPGQQDVVDPLRSSDDELDF